MKAILYLSITLILFSVTNNSLFAQNSEVQHYIVKKNDMLSSIAVEFYGKGNSYLWKRIYSANKEVIDDTTNIYPGQTLIIPPFKNSDNKTITENNVTKTDSTQTKSDSTKSDEAALIKEFRAAFNNVVDKDNKKEKKSIDNSELKKKSESYGSLNLGGLILDETRSKVGGDFYRLFYNHWETPEDVENATITISERTIPSTGVVISIKIERQLVFQRQIEPRYYAIEQTAKQAVDVCLKVLKSKNLNINSAYGL